MTKTALITIETVGARLEKAELLLYGRVWAEPKSPVEEVLLEAQQEMLHVLKLLVDHHDQFQD